MLDSDIKELVSSRLALSGSNGTGSIATATSAVQISEQIDAFLPTLARKTCVRRFGIGADGLLVLANGDEGQIWLRMFNPDGSEDFCGNGLRCSALMAKTLGYVQDNFAIHHGNQWVPVKMLEDGWIETTLGSASYAPKEVPHKRSEPILDVDLRELCPEAPAGYTASSLTTGSTHLVVRGELPADNLFFSISPKLEVSNIFPQSTSIMWTNEIAPSEIRLRIWERGAGETLGCGTGSTASAIDTVRRSGENGLVTVHNPGGTLKIFVQSPADPVRVSGVAHRSFEGSFPIDW